MSKAKLLMSFFYAFFLPVLLSLGIWQWHRYQYKLQIQQEYFNATKQAPKLITDQESVTSINPFDPIKATGRYLKSKDFLVDNQIFKGKYGYSLITPFLTTDNILIFVNRGWVIANDDKSFEVLTDKNNISITGIAYRPLKKPILLKEDLWQKGWPKLIQAIDISKMSQEFNNQVMPMVMVLHDNQLGIKTFRDFNAPIKPYTHLGYCIQWFLMAIALTILYIIYFRKI